MTDLVGAIDKIKLEETRYLDSLGDRFVIKLGKNINALIDAFGNISVIGEIRITTLSVELFQSRRGSGWVRMEGQDITGSDYAVLTGITELPNMLGKFPRAQDPTSFRDPDGAPRALFSEQSESVREHHHQTTWWSTAASAGPLKDNPTLAIQEKDNAVDSYFLIEGNAQSPRGSTSQPIGTANDARPRNIAVNYMIRINV